MTNMQQIAAYLNNSDTGCIATVGDDTVKSVSVEVPGLLSHSGGKTARFYSTEKIYTMTQALRLVSSMQ